MHSFSLLRGTTTTFPTTASKVGYVKMLLAFLFLVFFLVEKNYFTSICMYIIMSQFLWTFTESVALLVSVTKVSRLRSIFAIRLNARTDEVEEFILASVSYCTTTRTGFV
jgi:hypothetical protein